MQHKKSLTFCVQNIDIRPIEINNEIEDKINWTNCNFKVNGKKVPAKINMKTQEIRDLEGNVLRSGV